MGVIRCPNDVKVYTAPLCSSYHDGQKHGVTISRLGYFPGKGLYMYIDPCMNILCHH